MHVVVVGGGIVGMASAHYLAARGADVVVCERSSVGSGSTERAVGGIRAQFSTPVNVRLSLAAMAVWDRFEEEFGTDIEHRRVGYSFLARDPETADRLRERVAMQREAGVEVDLLAPAELREHVAVRPDRFELGTYSPRDGIADPHLALQGFATRARERGVEVRTNTAVRAIEQDPTGRVRAVETDDGRIETDCVVNAAGPWARAVADLVDLDPPVSPQRRQVVTVEPEKPVPEDTPLTFDQDRSLYFAPDREGAALVGGQFGSPEEVDPDGFSTDYDLTWATEALERAGDCAEYFGLDAGIKSGWAGLYAVTPDHHPIVEESLPGFVQAVGFSGHGFMHAPATGQVVAELVTEGEATTVDVGALSAGRFDPATGASGTGPREMNVL
jgi:sarcosine oxidase subunit beta